MDQRIVSTIHIAGLVKKILALSIHIAAITMKHTSQSGNMYCSLKGVHIEAFNMHCGMTAQNIEWKVSSYIPYCPMCELFIALYSLCQIWEFLLLTRLYFQYTNPKILLWIFCFYIILSIVPYVIKVVSANFKSKALTTVQIEDVRRHVLAAGYSVYR